MKILVSVCYFRWILQLDREGTIFYSTAPTWISLPANTSKL